MYKTLAVVGQHLLCPRVHLQVVTQPEKKAKEHCGRATTLTQSSLNLGNVKVANASPYTKSGST